MTTQDSARAGEGPAAAEELPFQAEVKQVLSLVINSLYTHKEVFLRELVSNASDALDKARFFALTQKDVAEQVGEPRIVIRLDEAAGTITVEDNGVGMTRDEVVQNLGTIARSGSLEFVKAYADAQKSRDAGLKIIGQFGVGFYAAFMVASRVDVRTRSMTRGAEPIVWRSSGGGTFNVAPGDREHPGTEVVLHLKEDEREYLRPARVREIIKKYSDFVQFPIYLGEELVNRSSAIWALPKAQVKEEQHTEFFRRITGFDAQTPLLKVHLSVDAPVQFHALLYVPEKAPLDLFSKDRRGLRLYARRVLIVEDCDKLAPSYLRFLRGVVDSEDVPLNVSRELLQEDRSLSQVRLQITRAVLRELADLAEHDAPRYARLFAEFGRVLKEGVAASDKHRDELIALCRFESLNRAPGELIGLGDYVTAMPEGQKEVYFVTGPSRAALEQGPHIEALKKRGYDVLLLTDPIDEWVVQSLTEFDGRPVKSAAHAGVDLGDGGDRGVDEAAAPAREAVKAALGGKVKDVRLSRRLTDSASCLVADEGDPSANLERIMKMLDRGSEAPPRILELNPAHPIIKNLSVLAKRDSGSPQVKQWSELLLDRAMLAEGTLHDAAELVRRLEALLTEVTAHAAGAGPSSS